MKFRRQLLPMILALAFCAQAIAGNGMHPAHAPKAMVATLQPDASEVGIAIMRQGGNAVDSAVAVGFALAVVLPQAGNIGGGGFMLFRRSDGEVHFLDFREKAPAKATANMYLDPQGNVVPGCSVSVTKRSLEFPAGGGLSVRAEALGQADAEAGDGAGRSSWPACYVLDDDGPVVPRPQPGEVSRVASHLSTRRRLLPAGRCL